MSLFDLLPNELLEYVLAYIPESRFPLRQVCRLLRHNVEPCSPHDFIKLCYLRGSASLVQHYQLACYKEDFQTVLEKGHEEVFRIRGPKRCWSFMASSSVQGKSRYIINSLLEQNWVSRSSLVYEACAQNQIELVKDLYTEEAEMYTCTFKAVGGEALDVLAWIVDREKSYYRVILQQALVQGRVKVLRWLPRGELRSFRKEDFFHQACTLPSLDLFNFLLEIDYLPRQKPSNSISLAKSGHVLIMETMVKRGWTLCEEMFEAALNGGSEEMLSCLCSLNCPRDDLETLYSLVEDKNFVWLVDNLPPTENILRDLCLGGTEESLIHLIQGNYLPHNFKDDPNITLAALEAGFTYIGDLYLEEGYSFYEDICLQVNNSASLAWLIENQVNLCSELYYHLVRREDIDLLQQLNYCVPLPADLLDFVFGLMREETLQGNLAKVSRLQKIVYRIESLHH